MIIGLWVKIGEVVKYGKWNRSNQSLYAVLERINEDGSRDYKEVYMASDTYVVPKLNSQKELESINKTVEV